MRWEPLHELVVWHSRASRLQGADTLGWAPSTDLYETPEAFCIAIELPGFRPGEFDVQATEQGVTITGQRSVSAAAGGSGQFLHVERSQGAFSRKFDFSQPIVVGEISATFEDGLLAVRVPKRPRALAAGQRVSVQSAES
jgi:HSP20 family protein